MLIKLLIFVTVCCRRHGTVCVHGSRARNIDLDIYYAVKAQVGSTSVSIIILIMDSHLANSSSGEEDSSEEESSSEAEGKTKARIDTIENR